MKKKYIIISTYPKEGSKNIGDQLITNSVIEALEAFKGKGCEVDVIWRGDQWENVESQIIGATAIIFACLAIRPDVEKEYPYLKNILDLDIPIGVISSGTALQVERHKDDLFDYVSDKSKELLRSLDKKALFFSTRGVLTQMFCESIGMKNTQFCGDIAFLSKELHSFPMAKKIKKIVVSDPHYSDSFIDSFGHLINKLKSRFSNSMLVVALHGRNELVKEYCKQNNIPTCEIYKDKDKGLSLYDEADLHVGYRVHAHVSSLKRGIYSYLLEQDGRGADYGATIARKISVPSYRSYEYSLVKRLSNLVKRNVGFTVNQSVPVSSVDMILSIIENDLKEGFSKFQGLENQFKGFQSKLQGDIKKLP